MQAGACTTALDGARDDFVVPKQAYFEQEKVAFDMPKQAAFEQEKVAFDMPKKAAFEQEKVTFDMPKKAARKRTKGTGDTETTGKHNKRFMAYSKAVKEGKLNPSRYALTRFDIDGKKIGSVTAVEFLLAMEKAGVVQRTEKGGKTAWAKCT